MRRNTSRQRPLPLLLLGLSVAAVAFAIASRRRAVRERLDAIFLPVEPASAVLPSAHRRRLPLFALAAYLLGLSIAFAPTNSRASPGSAPPVELQAEAQAEVSPPSDYMGDIGLCAAVAQIPDPSCGTTVQRSVGPATSADSKNTPMVQALPSPTPTPIVRPAPEPVATPVIRSAPVYVMSVPNGAVTYGIATWYGIVDGFTSDDTMADGNQFDPYDPTITASNSYPFGTWLHVCHDDRCINVCVHDRGAFTHALDLSMGAFAQLAPLSNGVIDVTIQVISYP
jgi:Lytic transglycolase